MSDTKMHWFCFSYTGNGGGGGQAYASTYTGYNDKNINVAMIQQNKKNADMPEDAVLLSVSYLGRMTKDEMRGGE